MKKLEIDSALVGIPWKVVEKEITWRETTNYAAALEDYQDCYFDDRGGKTLKTHPMFPVTFGWPLIIDIEDYLEIPHGREIIGQLVHFKTHIKYVKPISVPNKMKIESQIALLKAHNKGTEVSFQFNVTDSAGELCHIEYMTCILRDVICTGGDKVLPDYPEHSKEKGEQPLWSAKEIPVKTGLPYIYDGCSGIYNPIHTSPAFAESVGLPGVILQGTATIALGIREVIAKETKGDYGRVDVISAKLNSMVLQNQLLEVQLTARKETLEGREFFFQVVNKTTGELAVTYGYLKLVE